MSRSITCCALHDALGLEWDSAARTQMLALTAQEQKKAADVLLDDNLKLLFQCP